MVSKNRKRRIGRKPVMHKKKILPEPTPLQEAVFEISGELEELRKQLQYLTRCSIHTIESDEVWSLLSQVTSIEEKVAALGDE